MPKPWNAAEYLATYPDLQAAYGANPFAASWHWANFGQAEGRVCGFDGLDYVAGYGDLRAAFGANPWAGAMHWVQHGRHEGRPDNFDGAQYLANYADLRAAFGHDQTAAAQHYIVWGAGEGRSDDAPVQAAAAEPPPGQTITGTDGADTLNGGGGDDIIDGRGGTDAINGGVGHDTIHGGLAGDNLTGGPGADIFTFGTPWTSAATAPPMWDGGDKIHDFKPGTDKLDYSNLISDKGFDATFLGTGGFSTNPPIPRDQNSFQFIHGDFDSVEVRYIHTALADGTPFTEVQFDGPVHIGSAKFNPTPMDGNIDARLNLMGLHDLSAGDFIL